MEWFDPFSETWINTLPNPGSPALDGGQCGSITIDLRGASRPSGAACDIGAIERSPGDPKAFLNLPTVMGAGMALAAFSKP